MTWTNVTLKGMVHAAYQRFTSDAREIVGGPDWFNEARFDVIAVAPGGLPRVVADGFPSQLLAMSLSLNCASLIEQLFMGVIPEGTLPLQPQCGLQQPQNRVA